MGILYFVTAEPLWFDCSGIIERVHGVHHGSRQHFPSNVPDRRASDRRRDLGRFVRIEIDD